MGRAIMIQGTGSNVGKSLIVAGLCRHFRNQGLTVLPFKPQNMSNNAAVTADGGEIGRAQALQALACGAETHTDMNPVLLKPESETGAQVIVQGRRLTTTRARDYAALKPKLLTPVLESFARLRTRSDLVIAEGAGSPAEINLRAGDIANMGFARAAAVPVILTGDINRGGVIAQLAGTKAVIDPADAALIKGFLVNKFRGDPDLFLAGMAAIESYTGWPALGLLPWFPGAANLPPEDALDIRSGTGGGLKIAVPLLSRIANFDDFDPLIAEPGVTLVMVPPGQPLPADAALIILPGTKSTIGDLAFLRAQGWDIDIFAHHRRGGHVLGLCGGYQMLGHSISDLQGIEGPPATVAGLGLLGIETAMTEEKALTRVAGHDRASGAAVNGYEIHIGRSHGPDTARAWLNLTTGPEGAASPDDRVRGTYLHGLFTSDPFRSAFLAWHGGRPSGLNHSNTVEKTLDDLAAHIARHADTDRILALATN